MLGFTGGIEAIAIVAIVIFVMPVAIVRLSFKHKLEMAKLRQGQNESGKDYKSELDALRKRCDTLEKRCEELQLQVTDAHAQLADERRQLDLRLANMLPAAEAASVPGSAVRSAVAQKTIN